MLQYIFALLTGVRVSFRRRNDTAMETLALRQQLVVFKRQRPRPRLNQFDRLFWIVLGCIWSGGSSPGGDRRFRPDEAETSLDFLLCIETQSLIVR